MMRSQAMIDSAQIAVRLVRWELRRRLLLTLKWVPRGAVLGGMVGLAIVVAGHIRPLLTKSQLSFLAWGAVMVGVFIPLVFVWPRPFRRMVLARRFDIVLGLKERISTALEVSSGRLNVDRIWRRRLADDLTRQLHTVDIQAALPIKVELWDVFALVLIIGLLWAAIMMPNPAALEVERHRMIADAIAGGVSEIEAMLDEIESLEGLTDEARGEMSSLMMDSLEVLVRPDLSLEEAVAALADTEGSLRALADATNDELQQVLQEAASQLSGTELADVLSRAWQGGRLGDVDGEIFDGMSEERLREMSEALTQAARSLGGLSPKAAERLVEAASALETGDLEAAMAALNEASDALAEAVGENEVLAETARRMADRLRAERGAIAAAGSGGGGAGVTGVEPHSQGPIAAGDEGRVGAGSGTDRGNGSGEGTAPGGEAATGPTIPEQESQYSPIYAPEHIGGGQGEELGLLGSGDPGEVAIGEGDILQSGEDEALIPYSEVWSYYAEFAREAFRDERIPLALRDVIRDYFGSLQP